MYGTRGDWIASSLISKGTAGADTYFGNADDARFAGALVADAATVNSKITSIVAGGQVFGTPTTNVDYFGFVDENIGSFKVNGGTPTFRLIAGNSNDVFFVLPGFLGGQLDVKVNEICPGESGSNAGLFLQGVTSANAPAGRTCQRPEPPALSNRLAANGHRAREGRSLKPG